LHGSSKHENVAVRRILSGRKKGKKVSRRDAEAAKELMAAVCGSERE
jgi:hypothetical protein